MAAGSLAVALWLVGLEWAFTRLYALNFSVQGPNATLLLAAGLVTAWTLPVARQRPDRWPVLSLGLVLASGGLLVASRLLGLSGALLTTLGGLTALTPVVASLVGRLRDRVALAAANGVAVIMLARAIQHSVPPYGLSSGWVAIGVAGVGLAGCWFVLVIDGACPSPGTLGSPVAAVYALVFVEAFFLGSVTTVASWTLRPVVLVGVASVVGLLAGGAVVATRHPVGRRTGAWVAVYLLGLVDLVWLDLLAGATVLPVQAAAVVLVAGSCRRSGPIADRAAVALAAVQVASALVALLYVSAVNAPYLPGALSSLGGLETGFVAAGLALLPAVLALDRLGLAGLATGRASDVSERRSFLALAATASAALAVTVLRPLSSGPTPDEASTGEEIRAMTYNVHRFLAGDGAARVSLPAIATVIEDQNPHLVGLQETDGGRLSTGGFDGVRWLAASLGYHAVNPTPGRLGSYGVALLSRWPIRDTRLVRLPVGSSPPRLALVATVDAPDGPLRVIATHFETRRPGHRQPAAAARLVDLATGANRTIVLGDCNVRPDPTTPTYARLADALTDAWAAAPGGGQGYSYSASEPGERIDYVWLFGDWRIRNARVGGTSAASDHLAVTATVLPE